jgi:UTP-glucose-1-phosphate uridylyltransferase
MAPITTYLPKEMLPLAANPAIYYAVQEAIFLGINDICVITAK